MEGTDWWVDKANGSLIHTNGNNKPITGIGKVSYLGEDGMFGEEGKKIETEDNKTKNGETYISPEDSKKMAENSGYQLVPEKVLAETSVETHATLTPRGAAKTRNINRTEVYGDFTYVKKDQVSKTNSSKVLEDRDMVSGYIQVTIEQRSYYKPSKISEFFNIIEQKIYKGKNAKIYVGFDNYPKDGRLLNYREKLD